MRNIYVIIILCFAFTNVQANELQICSNKPNKLNKILRCAEQDRYGKKNHSFTITLYDFCKKHKKFSKNVSCEFLDDSSSNFLAPAEQDRDTSSRATLADTSSENPTLPCYSRESQSGGQISSVNTAYGLNVSIENKTSYWSGGGNQTSIGVDINGVNVSGMYQVQTWSGGGSPGESKDANMNKFYSISTYNSSLVGPEIYLNNSKFSIETSQSTYEIYGHDLINKNAVLESYHYLTGQILDNILPIETLGDLNITISPDITNNFQYSR